MRRTFLTSLVILAVSAQLLADLTCSNLTLVLDSKGVSCGACNQYATGRVTKSGSESGPVCLYVCGTHSYNVDDTSMTLYVGGSYGTTCYSVASGVSTVNWTLESSRDDWNDASGSYAEVYIGVPCWNCTVKHVTATWSTLCPYCNY